MKQLLFACSLLLGITPGFGQDLPEADTTLENLLKLKAETEASALQKMLNENVAAASKKQLSSRETPGIVSIISAEEIARLGARDLVDILRLVPGFEVALDVDFIGGIGLRGNWANEGKILLLVDGHEYNELLYQTVPVGNRFPVDHIQRIEIIRGPGSAVYGGTAEYGVINIITKGASGTEGARVSGTLGALPNAWGRKNLSLATGAKLGQWHLDGSYFQDQSIKSDQWYQDLYQENDPVNLADHTHSQSSQVNLGVAYRGTQVRGIIDRFEQQGPESRVMFDNWFLTAKNDIKLHKRWILTPLVSFTSQVPWSRKTITADAELYDYRVRAQRAKANLSTAYDITRRINLVVGAEYFRDRAESLLEDDNFGEDVSQVTYHNLAIFGQGLLRHPWANVTVGFRYDKHSAYQAAFVPRLALTKRINHFHFKALLSQSYRAPGIENINLNGEIRPERSNIAELELGYQFTQDMLLAFNAYHIDTKDVIIYSYMDLDDGGYTEAYDNADRVGSQGIEVVYKLKQPRWYANVNYALYQADPRHTVDTYRVPGHEKLFVAFPAHKISVQGSTQIISRLWFSPSLIHVSERYAYSAIDNEGTPVLQRFAPYTHVNLFLSYDHLLTKGLHLGIGVYDLLNAKAPLLQAYNGDYAPISGRSREAVLKLSYQFSFKQQ